MRFFVLALLGSFLGILGSAGCSSGASCSATFAACGGDLTGTWTYQTNCNAGSTMAVPNCPAATSDVTNDISGTITFNADKTYAVDLTLAESGSATIPASCLVGAPSCSSLSQNNTTDGLTIKTSCTGDITKSCTCTLSESGTFTQTGTYATAGKAVTMTPKGGTPGTPASYCVKGSELDVSGAFMSGMMASSAYAIFTK